jgi:hypothetical protein
MVWGGYSCSVKEICGRRCGAVGRGGHKQVGRRNERTAAARELQPKGEEKGSVSKYHWKTISDLFRIRPSIATSGLAPLDAVIEMLGRQASNPFGRAIAACGGNSAAESVRAKHFLAGQSSSHGGKPRGDGANTLDGIF